MNYGKIHSQINVYRPNVYDPILFFFTTSSLDVFIRGGSISLFTYIRYSDICYQYKTDSRYPIYEIEKQEYIYISDLSVENAIF